MELCAVQSMERQHFYCHVYQIYGSAKNASKKWACAAKKINIETPRFFMSLKVNYLCQ